MRSEEGREERKEEAAEKREGAERERGAEEEREVSIERREEASQGGKGEIRSSREEKRDDEEEGLAMRGC